MNVTLPPKLAALVRAKVASGFYGDEGEVVRDALRLLSQRDAEEAQKLQILRAAVKSGLASGIDEHFSFAALNARLDAEATRTRRRGKPG